MRFYREHGTDIAESVGAAGVKKVMLEAGLLEVACQVARALGADQEVQGER